MTTPVSVLDDASVFPAASPGRAREVDAAGGVRWGEQIGRPRSAGNTARAWPSYLNRHNREDFGL